MRYFQIWVLSATREKITFQCVVTFIFPSVNKLLLLSLIEF
jgi:hypothetical protein